MVAIQYGVSGIPHNAILDTSMKVIYTAAGYSTGIHSVILNHINNYYEPAYANQLDINHDDFVQMGVDTLLITSVMENPYNHTVELYAMFESVDGSFNDSLMLYDDGSHNDGAAGDGLYGNSMLAPNLEHEFMVGLNTVDFDYNVNVVFDDVSRFTTVGPVILDGYNRTTGFGSYLYYQITLRNSGQIATAQNVTAKLIIDDPYITNIIGNDQSFGNIDAGQTAICSGKYTLVPSNLPPTHTIDFQIEIYGNGNLYWTDSSSIVVGITNEDDIIPKTFSLEQNYPNPFNPKTTIEFSIPKSEYVELKIFDVNGKEIQTLVSDNMNAGTYQYDWQAAGTMASGIYFYTIEAGTFKQTRKLVLMK